jgi:transcriptional regulator with XRE-family HTH domain
MTTTQTSRREDLRDFLRSRRARVRPEEVGLPGGARRTPGLRREEVAVLAGIGVSWYTWLEQGRDIKVSDSVVQSISRVLRLDPAESAYFYRLAGLNPPVSAPVDGGPSQEAELERLLDSWAPYPGYVLDLRWNYVLSNAAAQAVFGVPRSGGNCLELFFTDPRYQSFFANRDRLAPEIVATFRTLSATYPDDDGFGAIQRRLYAQSPEFARLWDQHDVRAATIGSKDVVHPYVGELSFDHHVMNPADRPDLRVIVHLPRGEDARDKLERLLREFPGYV